MLGIGTNRMVWREAFNPFPPAPFPILGKGGGSGGYIPRRALGVAQPGPPVKGAEHRRAAAALPLTGGPDCAMGGAATGDIPQMVKWWMKME